MANAPMFLSDDPMTLQEAATVLRCSVKTIYRTPFLRSRVEYVGCSPRLRRSVINLYLADQPKGVRRRVRRSA